jgi:hypothetical protein
MSGFRLSCPDCKARLSRQHAVDWHLPIEQIKWLYLCKKCQRRWIYYPLQKAFTEEGATIPERSSAC